MRISLDQRVAIVTGGASGIGEACVRTLADAGARIVVADKNIDRARRVATETGAVAIMLDVGDDAQVERAIEEIERDVGAIDVLINSAGVLQRPLPPDRLGLKEWDV